MPTREESVEGAETRICSACSARVSADRPKCGVCGELLIGDRWRSFLERYDLASREEQKALVEGLSPERREAFERVHEAWEESHPEERTTSIVNPLPPVRRPSRSPTRIRRTQWLVVALPAAVGIPLVLLFASSPVGLGALFGISLVAAVWTARTASDSAKIALLSSWLVVSLASALSLYYL